jgi:hypothetical protein
MARLSRARWRHESRGVVKKVIAAYGSCTYRIRPRTYGQFGEVVGDLASTLIWLNSGCINAP